MYNSASSNTILCVPDQQTDIQSLINLYVSHGLCCHIFFANIIPHLSPIQSLTHLYVSHGLCCHIFFTNIIPHLSPFSHLPTCMSAMVCVAISSLLTLSPIYLLISQRHSHRTSFNSRMNLIHGKALKGITLLIQCVDPV